VRRSRAIAAAPAFDEWSVGEYFPGPTVETDEEISTFVRTQVSTWFHPAGSCTPDSSDLTEIFHLLPAAGREAH